MDEILIIKKKKKNSESAISLSPQIILLIIKLFYIKKFSIYKINLF